ncbi:MAG: gas vesicle protein [Planctomycetia bacterium]|nr:gas vesicle protein [Planctomycetia bacterium]
MARTQLITQATRSEGLADVLERVLDKGLVIAGDIKVKLCDVELLTVQIRLLIASVDKAQEMGLTWWWQERPAEGPPKPHSAPDRGNEGWASLSAPSTPWEHYQRFRDERP